MLRRSSSSSSQSYSPQVVGPSPTSAATAAHHRARQVMSSFASSPGAGELLRRAYTGKHTSCQTLWQSSVRWTPAWRGRRSRPQRSSPTPETFSSRHILFPPSLCLSPSPSPSPPPSPYLPPPLLLTPIPTPTLNPSTISGCRRQPLGSSPLSFQARGTVLSSSRGQECSTPWHSLVVSSQ